MEPMRSSTRVTIKDIAERAGVSKTTISQPGLAKGSEAGRLIQSLLEGDPMEHVQLPACLQTRASVGSVSVFSLQKGSRARGPQ